jgi:hypothetical protein
MNKPSTPGEKRGRRRPLLAKLTSSTKLYADDYKTVDSLAAAWGETPAGVIRVIVHDWLRSQRVRALGRDEAAEQVRAVYERVVSEQVAPLAAAVRGLKDLLENRASPQGQPATGSRAHLEEGQVSQLDVMTESLRRAVEQAASDLAESSVTQLEQMERLAKLITLSNRLAGENFAATWAVRDWVIRFLVEVDMLSHNKQPDAVAEAVSSEKLVLLREACDMVALVEDDLGVAEEDQITLSEQIHVGQPHQSDESCPF